MAHAQKPVFVFRRNGRVHLNRRGRQFSRLLTAEVCASAVVMLETPCSEVVWRVPATHSIRQFPLHFPSRASPCAITFQLDFTTFSVSQISILKWSWYLLPKFVSSLGRFSPFYRPRGLLGWVEVQLYSFWDLGALDGGGASAPRPDRIPPAKTRYPSYRRLGGPQCRFGRADNLVPTGIRSRTVQPVVSSYTNWATRPPVPSLYLVKFKIYQNQ